MKHIFVINPKAGKKDSSQEIIQKLHAFDNKIDYEIYITQYEKDAIRFVKEYCARASEELRFYACGGDGTMNEVAKGLLGCPHAALSCYPCGSGNDFVKYYADVEDFLDIGNLIDGEEHIIDIFKSEDTYVVNAVNFGFDTGVCKVMKKVRRTPVIGGDNAYATGIAVALFNSMKTYCKITADGETLIDDDMLLCTLANGKYVGGSFQCAPRAVNDDGEIEICIIKKVSYPDFFRILLPYKDGTHLDSQKLSKHIVYRRAKKIEVEIRDGLLVSFDGELMDKHQFTLEIIEKALRFVAPKKRGI